jgi:two-component system, response regulator PdtaR
MNYSLRISVADDEPRMREYFEDTLSALGHQVVSVAATGRELVEQCREHHPDLVITDIKMPELDGIHASDQLRRDAPVPIILVSAFHDPELIDQALRNHVLAYLVKPIKQADLETAIALAMRRFREFQALQKQAVDLQQALEDRKVIERAKGFLMKNGRLEEQEAFRRLQQLASEKNQKMVEIAKMIITTEQALKRPSTVAAR